MSGVEEDRDDTASTSGGKAKKDKKGSGSAAGSGSGGGGGSSQDRCNIREPAPLNSPKAVVVDKLKAGDVLRVVVDPLALDT